MTQVLPIKATPEESAEVCHRTASMHRAKKLSQFPKCSFFLFVPELYCHRASARYWKEAPTVRFRFHFDSIFGRI